MHCRRCCRPVRWFRAPSDAGAGVGLGCGGGRAGAFGRGEEGAALLDLRQGALSGFAVDVRPKLSIYFHPSQTQPGLALPLNVNTVILHYIMATKVIKKAVQLSLLVQLPPVLGLPLPCAPPLLRRISYSARQRTRCRRPQNAGRSCWLNTCSLCRLRRRGGGRAGAMRRVFRVGASCATNSVRKR